MRRPWLAIDDAIVVADCELLRGRTGWVETTPARSAPCRSVVIHVPLSASLHE